MNEDVYKDQRSLQQVQINRQFTRKVTEKDNEKSQIKKHEAIVDLSIDITKENLCFEKDDIITKIKQEQLDGKGNVMYKLRRQNNMRHSSQGQQSSIEHEQKRSSTTDQIKVYQQTSSVDYDSLKEESSSEGSDIELPKTQLIVRAELKNNEFLKMYQMNNNTHEGDREKAACIVNNLTFNKQIKKTHPFFNKKKKKEPQIVLQANDLFMLAQLTEEQLQQMKGQNEIEIRRNMTLNKRQRTMKQANLKIEDQEEDKIIKQQMIDTPLKSKTALSQEQYQSINASSANLVNPYQTPIRIYDPRTEIQIKSAQNLKSRNNNVMSNYRPYTQELLRVENNNTTPTITLTVEETLDQSQQPEITIDQPEPTIHEEINIEDCPVHEKIQQDDDYSHIINQVSKSNSLQLKKFHQQRLREINKKFKGLQKYSIEDFISFDREFASKIQLNKDGHHYQFKSQEQIEKESMRKSRERQRNALDKTTYFTKVYPHSFIKRYTTKYHLEENDLLPFHQESNSELHIKHILRTQKKNLRTQQNFRNSPLKRKMYQSEVKADSAIKIQVNDSVRQQTPLDNYTDNKDQCDQMKTITSVKTNNALNRSIRNAYMPKNAKMTFYTTGFKSRNRTVDNRTIDSQNTPSRRNQSCNSDSNNELFNDNQTLKDHIISCTKKLDRKRKKEQNLFNTCSKLIDKQTKLKKFVDDKINDLDEVRHTQKQTSDKEEQQIDSDYSQQNNFLYHQQHQNNFLHKVKVWNINELKKTNSTQQKQFYNSMK